MVASAVYCPPNTQQDETNDIVSSLLCYRRQENSRLKQSYMGVGRPPLEWLVGKESAQKTRFIWRRLLRPRICTLATLEPARYVCTCVIVGDELFGWGDPSRQQATDN